MQPSVSKVPWALQWGSSSPGGCEGPEAISLGPDLSAPESKGALAVDISLRQLKLSLHAICSSSSGKSNRKSSSRSNEEMWIDVVAPTDLQLHLFIERDVDSRSRRSSSSSNGKNSNISNSNESRGPPRWRASVHLLGADNVRVSLDSFSLFYFVCALKKLQHLRRLALLSAYRPTASPSPKP